MSYGSKADIAHNYLTTMLPTVIQRRIYRDYEWDNYPMEYKILDRALTLFSITPGMNLYFKIIYDFYVQDLSNKQIAEKYKYSMRQMFRIKDKALELFFSFIPNEYR